MVSLWRPPVIEALMPGEREQFDSLTGFAGDAFLIAASAGAGCCIRGAARAATTMTPGRSAFGLEEVAPRLKTQMRVATQSIKRLEKEDPPDTARIEQAERELAE